MRLEGTEEVHFASKAVDVRDGEAPDLIAANFYSLSRHGLLLLTNPRRVGRALAKSRSRTTKPCLRRESPAGLSGRPLQ